MEKKARHHCCSSVAETVFSGFHMWSSQEKKGSESEMVLEKESVHGISRKERLTSCGRWETKYRIHKLCTAQISK